jgi:dTDP-4-amino-4,6-dideoxygalactose transaminase
MTGRLVILGGERLRARPLPEWPQYDERELRNLEQVVRSRRWFAGMRGGDPESRVAEFERRFAEYCGVAHAVACANGTVAIEIALRAAGVGPGDEVIVPALTFISTASAALLVGATPVMVDAEPKTYCMDPSQAEAAVTGRTRAMIPVHYAGHCCDMDALLGLAGKRNLLVIEDAAHAPGATWRGAKAGSMGHFGTFSFQESKTMTAGEGGIITTNDAALAEGCVSYRSCGRRAGESWYIHYLLPVNQRMVELEAAVLLAQLERFPQQLARRQQGAAFLDRQLAEIPGISALPRDPRCETHGYYLYQFRFDSAAFDGVSRDTFVRALEAEGIPCHIGYPWPLNRNPFFQNDARIRDQRFPVAERLCAETVVLPHQVLLAGPEDLQDVVRAVAKIREHRHELTGLSLTVTR